MKFGSVVAVGMACASVAGMQTAAAQTGPPSPARRVLILVDVSKSMSDDDGTGTQKMAGARRATLSLLANLPAGVDVGLQSYPGKTQCSPGRYLVPVGHDAAALDLETHSLIGEGDGTPTGPALRFAADNLRLGGRAGSILLISDGESNCGDDPCAVTEELFGQDVDVTVNTVGFRVSPEGERELRCIAVAGHGRYTEVSNSAEIQVALEQQGKAQLRLVARSAPEGTLEVVADLSVVGARPAPDVVVTAEPTQLARTVNPIRRLGNLEPGVQRELTWEIAPTRVVNDRTAIAVQITATAQGEPVASATWRTVLTRSTTDPNRPVGDAGRMVDLVQAAATRIEATCRRNRDNRNWFGRTWHWLSRNDLENCMNDAWVREIARRFAGLDPGRLPLGGGPEGAVRSPPPEEIEGSKGWKRELINGDESPGRHFLGWLAVGYFHPWTANSALSHQESVGIKNGESQQDVRSGRLAIDIGIDLRRGRISVDEAIGRIISAISDPSYPGGAQESEEAVVSSPWYVP